jgi:CheY-like chemotaxis protein
VDAFNIPSVLPKLVHGEPVMGKDNITLLARVCIFESTSKQELGAHAIWHWLRYPIHHSMKLVCRLWQRKAFALIWPMGFLCFYRWGGTFNRLISSAKNPHRSSVKKQSIFFKHRIPLKSQLLAIKKTSFRVLLVEDNPTVQLIHREMLLKLGCKVDIAANGQQALNQINKAYELVLLDIGLPDISGVEVAEGFRRRQPGSPPRIIAVTAHAGVELRKACLSVGIEQVLFKPLDFPTLKNLIYPI